MHLGLPGQQLRQHASKAERVLTERCPHPLVARGCGVSLVEDQVDHGQHGFEPLSQLVAARRLEGNMSLGQCLLGSKDALAQRLLRHQERPGNLGRGEAAGQAQGQRNAPLDGQHRMAGGKDQAEDIIINDLVQRVIHGFTQPLLLEFQLSRNLSMLEFQHPATAQSVDGAPLCRCHQPRGRFFRDTFVRPSFESCNKRILSEFLRNADVAGHAGNPCDESRGLDLPHGLDRFMCVAHA